MKNLKKFVALLLAGVMAMVMLTACSGGGNNSNLKENTDAEAKVLGKYSTSTAKNDKELKAKADQFLNEKLQANASILGYKLGFVYDIDGKNDNVEFLTVLVAANFDYEDTLLDVILTQISQKINTDWNVDISQNGNWTDIGVVVKSDSKHSYMAIAFKVKNPKYKSN